MTLHLMQCRPNTQELAVWATRQRLLSPDGDYGYALHALLAAAFGGELPQPFRFFGARQGLLAYSRLDLAALRDLAALAAPDVAAALGLDTLAARPFPVTWRAGQRLAFEVRARPVVRTNDGRERDAYLHALGPEAGPSDSATGEGARAGPSRSGIYLDWLSKRIVTQRGATIEDARLDAFRLTRLLVRPSSPEAGKRRPLTVNGPDVLFKGHLRVTEGDAFAAMVARGVGRHRAFGYGMLLLKPPC